MSLFAIIEPEFVLLVFSIIFPVPSVDKTLAPALPLVTVMLPVVFMVMSEAASLIFLAFTSPLTVILPAFPPV